MSVKDEGTLLFTAQILLANIQTIDPNACIRCAIGIGESTLDTPVYMLDTEILIVDGHITRSLSSHAPSPVEVLEKFYHDAMVHRVMHHTFTYRKEIFEVDARFCRKP